jgi:hypothetical protein
MNFDQFFGLDVAIGHLRVDFNQGRFVHAYLLSGPRARASGPRRKYAPAQFTAKAL